MTEGVIIALALLNVVQFFFWGAQVHRLVNKLMSRDFAEYNAIVKGPMTQSEPKVDIEAEIEEKEILKELNSMVSIS